MSLISELYEKPKKEPIILDRSRLERIAECPHRDRLCIEHNIEPENSLLLIGETVHKIVEEAFEFAENDFLETSEYLLEELPKARPDIQPEVLRTARSIADTIMDLHVKMLGCEQQISYEIMKPTYSRGAVKITQCLDLICAGLDNSLHVHDWKTGWKKYTDQEAWDLFQSQCASYILWQIPDFNEVETIYWWYHSTRHGSRAFARHVRTRSHRKMPELTEELQFRARINEAVRLYLEQSDEAWPEPKKCLWCEAKHHCKHASREVKDYTKDPKGWVDNYIVIEALYKTMKKTASDLYKGTGEQLEGTASVIRRKKPADRVTLEVVERPEEPTAKKINRRREAKTKSKESTKNGKKTKSPRKKTS
jgi:hypothetical protein